MLQQLTTQSFYKTIPIGILSFNQGCGVGVGGVACFQMESVFETDGVGVGFSKLLESESGVGTFVAITDSNVY